MYRVVKKGNDSFAVIPLFAFLFTGNTLSTAQLIHSILFSLARHLRNIQNTNKCLALDNRYSLPQETIMIKVGIIGASGYAGAELARIISNHPHAELVVATSRQYEGQPLSEVFPNLRDKVDLICENPSVAELAEKADIFFAAVPHKTAMDLVPSLLCLLYTSDAADD